MVDKKDDLFLADNVKGLMMDLVAEWNRRMDQAQGETEFADVRPSDQRLFGHMRGRPTPLSEFHTRLGISRQAAQQSVARLQAQGLVELRPVPGSGRDKIVRVTRKGQRLRKFAAQQIRQFENDCANVLGKQELNALRKQLKRLVAAEREADNDGKRTS